MILAVVFAIFAYGCLATGDNIGALVLGFAALITTGFAILNAYTR